MTRRTFAKDTLIATAAAVVAGAAPSAAQSAKATSKEETNKAIVGRWFKEFWSNPWNPAIVDELAAPDMLLQYSLHAPGAGVPTSRRSWSGSAPRFPT